MARRPRAQSRKPQSNLVTPLAVFVVLFVFSFGLALYSYMSWRDLDRKIYGNFDGTSEFEELDSKGEEYFGYLALLEQEQNKRRKDLREKKDLEDIIGISHVDRLGDEFAKLGEEINRIYESKGQDVTFVEFMRQLADEKKNFEQRLNNATAAKDKMNADLSAAREKSATNTRSLNGRIDELQSALDRKNRQIATLDDSHRDTVSKLANKIYTAKTKNQKLHDEYEKKSQRVARDLARVEKALKEVQSQKVGGREFKIDYAEQDGVVINVDKLGESCSVDIGRKHGAQVGMQFVVYEAGPGGKRREKGTIELKKIHADFSIAEVTSIEDDLDPILTEDIVISPIFKRGAPLTFVLEADIDRLDKETLARKIERYGNRVAEGVTPQTDFVVIKDMPGEMAEEAGKWAIRVIRLSDIEKVLGES